MSNVDFIDIVGSYTSELFKIVFVDDDFVRLLSCESLDCEDRHDDSDQ